LDWHAMNWLKNMHVLSTWVGEFIDPLRNLKVSRPLGKVDNRSDGRGCKLGNLAIAVNLIV
jgi:hypothetical protein